MVKATLLSKLKFDFLFANVFIWSEETQLVKIKLLISFLGP